jgi:BirA family biotin operon repressor/biotin-[acetyl-CoA-carboxylase] ligase
MRTRQRLMQLLSEEHFMAGTELGKQLGISRAAVHKHISALKASGLPVDGVSGRGYRLARGIVPLDGDVITRYLNDRGRRQFTKIFVEQSVDSTSNVLRRLSREESVHGAVSIEESQDGGRGRRGNPWISSAYRNLLLSMGWVFDSWPLELTGLAVAAGVTLIDTMEELGIENLGMKWPNDIVYEDKKLGGVLIDVSGESSGACTLIIGVGINVHIAQGDGALIEQPWTDLATVLGRNVDRNELAGACIYGLNTMLLDYPRTGLDPYRERWTEVDVLAGRQVTIMTHESGGLVHGRALGLGNAGALILAVDGGGRKLFYSGELSVRKR